MERGHRLRLAGRPRNAVPAYQAAVRRAPTRGLQAEARANLALALRGSARYREALVQVSEALRAFVATRDREGLAFASWARGSVLRYMGDVTASRRAFGTARATYGRLGSREGLAYTCCGLGGCARLGGTYRESLRNYQDAWRIFSRLRDAHGLAYAACGTGSALRYAGRHRDAAGWYREAVARYRRLGDRANVGLALWEWGMLERQRGREAAARARFLLAGREFDRARDPRGRVLIALAGGRFRAAQSSARRLGLRADALHAQLGLRRGAMTAQIRRGYRRIGVRPPGWSGSGLILA